MREERAIEWLSNRLFDEFGFAFSNNILEEVKAIEEEQLMEYSLAFANWLIEEKLRIGASKKYEGKSPVELWEIFLQIYESE